jgi:hypothetical protein
MKTLYSILLLMLISTLAYSQAPEAFNYQAVIRNSAGDILANSQVAVQVSMLQDTETGTAVYVERFNPTTNDYGLIALKLGMGNVQSGTFSTIDWGAHSYYIKIEVDPNNGTAFTSMGTSQLLSVPYAMYAAGGPPGEISDNSVSSAHIINETIIAEDISPNVFTGWDKDESDDFDGAFSSLSGIPAGLYDGDDNTQLDETQVEAYIDGDETSFNGWDKNAADDFSGDYNDLANNPNLSNMISITSPQDGDIVYYSSGNWMRLPRGANGESLHLEGGLPVWREYGSTNIQGDFQFVTFGAGSATPLAYGFIREDATIASGTGNFTCIWNAGLARYEITITGQSYLLWNYSTVVTLPGTSVNDGAIPRVNSIGGRLVISIER